jgi:predicted nucleotidyltransferase
VFGYLSALEAEGVPIQAAYVFGSWVNGRPHRWSDIDVCVISPAFRNWGEKVELLAKARTEDFFVIEPHGFHPKDFKPQSNVLAHEVIAQGIRVQ